MVDEQAHLFQVDAQGRGKPGFRADTPDPDIVSGHGYRLDEPRQLGLIDLSVTANQHKNQFALAIPIVKDGLGRLARLNAEKSGHFVDAAAIRRMDFFQRQRLFHMAFDDPRGDLLIGHIRAVLAGDDGIFANGRQEHEFMRDRAAHHPGVRLDHGHFRNARASKNALIGAVATRVAGFQIVLRRVERVGVFHGEFADTDQAAPGTGFIAEFGLNLVQHKGKLSMAVHLMPGQMNHGLLVSHGEKHVVTGSILQAQQLRTDAAVSPRFLPEFTRQDDRHQHLLAANLVHFLADDLFDFPADAKTGREQRIDPVSHLPCVSAAQQKRMALECRFRGPFFVPRTDEVAHSHGVKISCVCMSLSWEYALSPFPRLENRILPAGMLSVQGGMHGKRSRRVRRGGHFEGFRRYIDGARSDCRPDP